MEEDHPMPASETSTCLWIIKNIIKWPIPSEHLFTVNVRDIECHIRLSSRSGLWIDVFVDFHSEQGTRSGDSYIVECSLIDTKFHQMNKHSIRGFFANCTFFATIIIGEFDFKKDDMLHRGKDLVTYFQITVDNESSNNNCLDPSSRKTMIPLFSRSSFSDFVIRVGEKEFTCHKFLLACRSKYFATMFRHDMKENLENKLIVNDVDPHIFEQLLRYMYTGKADVTEYDASQLLAAAAKFQLPRLMAMCENKLYSCICSRNATAMFSLANTYNLWKLKKKASLILIDFAEEDSKGNFQRVDPNPLKKCRISKGTTTEGVFLQHSQNKEFYEVIRAANGISTMEAISHSDFSSEYRQASVFHVDSWNRSEFRGLAKKRWTIKNVLGNTNRSASSTDSCSHTVTCNKATWLIEICEKNDYFCLVLKLIMYKKVDTTEKTLSVEYRFSILNTKQKEVNVVAGAWNLSLQECHKVIFVLEDDLVSSGDLLHDGDLIVCYRFVIRESSLYHLQQPTVPESDLKSDIGSLLHELPFTDVILSVKYEKFACHKAVIAYYSPYLGAEFETSPEVEIVDLEPKTVQKLLTIMYCGECEFTTNELLEVIRVAKKYGFFQKTTALDEAFCSTLSIDNAVKILIKVHSENVTKLKAHMIQFVAQNFLEIVKTSDWPVIERLDNLRKECLNAFISCERNGRN